MTAKDKLRLMLARGLDGIAFFVREGRPGARWPTTASRTWKRMVGPRASPTSIRRTCRSTCWMPGSALLERGAAKLLYLSLSDFVQHAHAPGEAEANAFNRAVDERIAALMAPGAVVGVVADHGMNDKSRPDGAPNVVFLEEELNARFGEGAVRVICPITDPFVRHHGALGSFVRVYMRKATDLAALMEASARAARRGGGGRGPRRRARASSCRSIWKATSWCWETPTPWSARAAPSMTCPGSPAIACARTAASASRRCRSWYRGRCVRTTWPRRKPLRNFDIFHAVLNGVA